MKKVAIIFPNQLFEDHPALSATRDVHLVEDERFFDDFKFHKKKLLFHRSSMNYYKEELVSRGYRVRHVRHGTKRAESCLTELISKSALEDVYSADPCDHKLTERLKRICKKHRKRLHLLESPAFLTSMEVLEDFLQKKKRLSMAGFYIKQRKRLGILLKDGKPLGDKWSFDSENRRRLPKKIEIPEPEFPRNLPSEKSHSQIKKEFHANPGLLEDFIFPVTQSDARLWLEDFLENRLSLFGDYEDAISSDRIFLFHSVLSPLLNSGLLTPGEILERLSAQAKRKDIPMNSLEGFIRQIIGWREFIRGAYSLVGEQQRKSNFWNFVNKLPEAFYEATTGIEPVDLIIRRVLHSSYCHHIERLMILGNFMLLCEIHPDDVYRWFMEMFIDAYDWVMVPNVYGMSQYADGGLMTSKPYISSSNYIRKMSDFAPGEWCGVWDALFWRFIQKHQKIFAANPRMRVMTFQLKRMGAKKAKDHIKVAERFLAGLLA